MDRDSRSTARRAVGAEGRVRREKVSSRLLASRGRGANAQVPSSTPSEASESRRDGKPQRRCPSPGTGSPSCQSQSRRTKRARLRREWIVSLQSVFSRACAPRRPRGQQRPTATRDSNDDDKLARLHLLEAEEDRHAEHGNLNAREPNQHGTKTRADQNWTEMREGGQTHRCERLEPARDSDSTR